MVRIVLQRQELILELAACFAGNIDKIYHGETLHRTAEYMRKKYFSA